MSAGPRAFTPAPLPSSSVPPRPPAVPVTIAKADGNPVNAASMLAVLGLGAQGGEEIVLASEADGAEAALDRLAKLVAEGLEELPETV